MQRLYVTLLISVLVISIETNAQFTKGTRMAGTSVLSALINSGSYEQTVTSIGKQTTHTSSYSIALTPSLGWFISDNIVAGVSLNVNPFGERLTYEENGSSFKRDKTTSFNAGAGGFVRNYFSKTGSVLPFGQFAVDAGIGTHKTEGYFYGGSQPAVYKRTYSGKSSGGFFTDLFLLAGVTKMQGQYTGLDLYLGYNFSYSRNTLNTTTLTDNGIDGTIDETGTNETVTKFTNHRFVLGIGFQVFLEKRSKKRR